jgi:acyl-CoA thioester hydrolase
MPPTHERTFRVRHYECDAYGHLNNAHYLGYMQETAFDASAALGYDLRCYESLAHHWLIRETEIEYLRPLQYGDRVTVRTWVQDFRRARSRRAYEFWAEEELVAKASSDWVYLDTATGRPDRVPPEMAAAFLPGGRRLDPPLRSRPFPSLSPPPPGVFQVARRVEWRDLDPVGHVNNAVYLSYAEDCGVQVARAYGWPLERWREAGFAAVARRHHIHYRHPAHLDELLELSTWLSRFGRATAVRDYTIRRKADDLLLAQVRTLWAWVDLETALPIRIPKRFLADFQPNLADTGRSQG